MKKRWSQKSESLPTDTALRLRGKILKSGRLSRDKLAARSLLVGWISEIRGYKVMNLRAGSRGSDTEKNLHIFGARLNRSRSIRLGMRKPHIYIINQPRKIPNRLSRCNRFLSSNHHHHHTHLHYHPHGVPYHQRNHHYRMEHRNKTLLYYWRLRNPRLTNSIARN